MPIDPIMGEYDEIIMVEGHRVFVKYPRITPEENERRWDEVCDTITRIAIDHTARKLTQEAAKAK
jgi:hypothetical protein